MPPRSKSKAPQSEGKKGARPRKGRDVLLVHGVSEDGSAYHVVRSRDNRLEAGVVRSVDGGVQSEGEVVKLTPRKEAPLLFDVDVEVPQGAINAPGSTAGKGPAQVATRPYRTNWDRIWKKRASDDLPN